ncbi:MAG: glycine cleavage system protein GcvH [Ardenticatenaceae bacterium]|nr:glycine cleavage system protein GcvH [Ardenticatenaceae bacterium]
MSYPADFLYSQEHEWIQVNGDEAIIGITAFAQQELGEVVYVELPEADQNFSQGDEIGTIESVKAVAELYIPVSGVVLEVNEAVVDDPEVLNDDPHGEGWLVKIRMSNVAELGSLMSAAAYEAFLREGE